MVYRFTHDSYSGLRHYRILLLFKFEPGRCPQYPGLVHPLCHVGVTLQASLSVNSPEASQQLIYSLFLLNRACHSFYTMSVSHRSVPCNHFAITSAHQVELISLIIIIIIAHRDRSGRVRKGFQPVSAFSVQAE